MGYQDGCCVACALMLGCGEFQSRSAGADFGGIKKASGFNRGSKPLQRGVRPMLGGVPEMAALIASE